MKIKYALIAVSLLTTTKTIPMVMAPGMLTKQEEKQMFMYSLVLGAGGLCTAILSTQSDDPVKQPIQLASSFLFCTSVPGFLVTAVSDALHKPIPGISYGLYVASFAGAFCSLRCALGE